MFTIAKNKTGTLKVFQGENLPEGWETHHSKPYPAGAAAQLADPGCPDCQGFGRVPPHSVDSGADGHSVSYSLFPCSCTEGGAPVPLPEGTRVEFSLVQLPRGEQYAASHILPPGEEWHDRVRGDGRSYQPGGPKSFPSKEWETKTEFRARITQRLEEWKKEHWCRTCGGVDEHLSGCPRADA